jgi:hypothetical protein
VHQSLPVGNGTVIRSLSATERGNKMLPRYGIFKNDFVEQQKMRSHEY